ncbi:MAG: hypothetical protein JO267_01685 [Alphaproteobacteria bacterium]|nr:hypothetical protein [Alphaproteobacteria bacterium]MBV9860838.1 hypothetical protein [Alphaproteobacteria bacterium]
MDQASDVERLFSWLKTQDLRYREFAAEREVSDAAATWPALHRAAAQSGRAGDVTAPAGDAAAKERLAREQMMMPPAAAEAIRAGTPVTAPPPLAGGRLMSALGRRMRSRPEPEDGAPQPYDEPAVDGPGMARDRSGPSAGRLRERLDAAMAVNPRPAPRQEPPVASRESYAPPVSRSSGSAPRGHFFGGVYGGREEPYRDEAAETAEGSRRGHSLQAVFSRMSGGRSRPLPDPRGRSRSSPGLGSVFNRLR